MRTTSKDKKLIRAPDDLISKLGEAANWQGKSFYRYISEILEQAVRSNEMNRSLKEIIDSYEMMEAHKSAGVTFSPRDALDSLISKVYDSDGDSLQRMWYETGRWYGIFLKGKFKDPFETFTKLLGDGLWGVKEVEVKAGQGNVDLRCVSIMLSQERTILLEKFVEGAMHSLGFKTEGREGFRGIISFKFSSSSV